LRLVDCLYAWLRLSHGACTHDLARGGVYYRAQCDLGGAVTSSSGRCPGNRPLDQLALTVQLFTDADCRYPAHTTADSSGIEWGLAPSGSHGHGCVALTQLAPGSYPLLSAVLDAADFTSSAGFDTSDSFVPSRGSVALSLCAHGANATHEASATIHWFSDRQCSRPASWGLTVAAGATGLRYPLR
jgi:hypothetical protein